MFGFLDAGVSVAYHVVTAFTHVLTPLAGAGVGTAAAIVAFTIAVRLLLSPLSYVALRGQAAQARLQPEIQELRRRHAGQPERLNQELAALYQRNGSGLLAGCLPLLAQLPFFSVMYRLFRSSSVGGRPNLLLTHRLFGAALGAHWLGGAGPASAAGLVFLGLFALLAAVGWASARLARQATALSPPTTLSPSAAPIDVSRQPARSPRSARSARPTRSARSARSAQPARSARPTRSAPPARSIQPVRPALPQPVSPAAGQEKIVATLTRIVPYTTVVLAMFVPLAAGLYLLTTTAWTVAERAALRRRAHEAATRKAATPGPAAA
jgi:YidC/Oxa1 family membrane protein insertase